ncbi:MAG: hypothetical protein FWF55_05515 [Treponema sp.]|nr:hypothetical protein [Treponema sp.]
MTDEEKEIRAAERKILAECRRWKIKAYKKWAAMTPEEREEDMQRGIREAKEWNARIQASWTPEKREKYLREEAERERDIKLRRMTPAERYAYWREEAEEWDAQRLAAMTPEEKQEYWREEIDKLNARMLASMTDEERYEYSWNAQRAQMEPSTIIV